MAIDTETKRRSAAVTALRLPFLPHILPVADGSIAQADRQHAAWLYGGIAAAAPAAVDVAYVLCSDAQPLAPWLTRYVVQWGADSDGDAKGLFDGLDLPLLTGGLLDRIVTVPDALAPPTANYDVTIADALDYDVLGGSGANRSATAVETVWLDAANTAIVDQSGAGRLTLTIANAGAGGAGLLAIYVLDGSLGTEPEV